MDFTKMGMFKLFAQRMEYLDQRQKLLAENVANGDTPGFKAKDLAPFSFRDAMHEAQGGGTMTRTNPLHLVGTRSQHEGPYEVREDKNPYEVLPSGASVTLEDQMVKVAQTTSDYQMVVGLYRKAIGMFRMALGRSG